MALLASIGAHCALFSLAYSSGEIAGLPVSRETFQTSLQQHLSAKLVYPITIQPAVAKQDTGTVRMLTTHTSSIAASSTATQEKAVSERTTTVSGLKFGLVPLEKPKYFKASELDERPMLLSPIDLDHLSLAQPEGGYLVLRLLIDKEGIVESAIVVTSDSTQVLEDMALKAFGNAHFSAGILSGAPVRSQVLIEVKLEPAFTDAQ